MKQSFINALGISCVLALSSCYTWQPPQDPGAQGASPDQGPNRYWSGPSNQQPAQDGTQLYDPSQPQQPQPNADGTYQPPTPGNPAQIQVPNPVTPPAGGGSNATVGTPTQPAPPAQTPAAPAPEVKPTGPQYGIKVPGKPGHIYSPYAKTEGLVDVQGYAPGTKVKCPYTGKVIIVP